MVDVLISKCLSDIMTTGVHCQENLYFTTYQLHGSQMFFPPQVSLVLRSHSCHHVVCVHYNVNKIVDDVRECSVTPWKLEVEFKKSYFTTVVHDTTHNTLKYIINENLRYINILFRSYEWILFYINKFKGYDVAS